MKIFLVLYQLANAAFMAAVAAFLPWRVIGWVLALAEHAGLTMSFVATNRLAWVMYLAFLGMTGWGLALRIRALLGTAFLGAKGLGDHLFR